MHGRRKAVESLLASGEPTHQPEEPKKEEKKDGEVNLRMSIFAAIAARIVILPPGGGEILLQMASPGTWRPEPVRQGRNGLMIEEIRIRQAANEPIASIARDAGVWRQRIHYLLKTDSTTR